MGFLREPAHKHEAPIKTAVVLVNLGTPDAPTASAVRRYLREFLSDPRVVEIPGLLWRPLLYGLILPLRSRRSAAKYASVWMREGSPLKLYTERQAAALHSHLKERGHELEVAHAMRYGKPSIPEVLDRLKADGCDRILVLPAYPQYSGTTTASVTDVVFRHLSRMRNVPELRIVKHYHDHDAYILALKKTVLAYWEANGRGDKLVMSFHGTPKRTLELGDPYFCECRKTARLLAEALQLTPQQYVVTFQSRFGKAEWLQPYTEPTVKKLAGEGVGRIDVMCPGFIADCLETLEEIGMEVRQAFLDAGGKEFHYIPCLNDGSDWIAALAEIAEQHLIGWPTMLTPQQREFLEKDAQARRERALTSGAKE